MSSTSIYPRPATVQVPDESTVDRPRSRHQTAGLDVNAGSPIEAVLEEVRELPDELAGAATAVREEIEATKIGRMAVAAYLWLLAHAPTSTRGRLIAAAIIFLAVLAPSMGMLYVTLDAGSGATADWFRRLGYGGIFLSNLASTATLFIPVPGLTAAAQALIVSSADLLSPFWVGVVGGLGMALGEVTAYVAGMATAFIASEEEIKVPKRLEKIISWVTTRVSWLMAHYGMPTLFVLSAFPNPFFEVAGWTAGATRYSFWRFMAAVTPGKVTRGLLLAYVGEKILFG
jgi:membrane protein YqaA with SNARE-associated domain